MPNKPSLENLARALAEERAALARCRLDNHEIFEKMLAFHEGRGPMPTIDEFVHWRDSIKQIIFEKKIDSGWMDL